VNPIPIAVYAIACIAALVGFGSTEPGLGHRAFLPTLVAASLLFGMAVTDARLLAAPLLLALLLLLPSAIIGSVETELLEYLRLAGLVAVVTTMPAAVGMLVGSVARGWAADGPENKPVRHE